MAPWDRRDLGEKAVRDFDALLTDEGDGSAQVDGVPQDDCLLRRGEEAGLKELLAAYQDEGRAYWLYTRALLAFREAGGDDEQAVALVKDAWSANEHVPAILAGAKPPVFEDSGYVTVGGPDEATYYFNEFGSAWHCTPGAVEWLAKITSTLPPKQRAYPAVH